MTESSLPRLVALDTETTGLSSKTDKVLELAALDFDPESGKVLRTYHQYLNPTVPISAEATAVHGLDDAFVADKPKFEEVAEKFIEYITGSILVIHNARFDEGMLDAELIKAGYNRLNTYVADIVDTLQMSRSYVRSKKHTLDVLCDKFGVDKTKRTLHGALVDCELLAQVYPHLVTAQKEFEAKFENLLSFKLGENLPSTLDECAVRALELDTIIKILSKDKARYLDLIKDALDGKEVEGETWKVEFSPRILTNWDKVTDDHLKGIDLTEYRKGSLAMTLKTK